MEFEALQARLAPASWGSAGRERVWGVSGDWGNWACGAAGTVKNNVVYSFGIVFRSDSTLWKQKMTSKL